MSFLFDDLYRWLGRELDPHILHVGGIMIKYPIPIVINNSRPKRTIRRNFEQLSVDVDTSLLLMHSQFLMNFSAAAPVHLSDFIEMEGGR